MIPRLGKPPRAGVAHVVRRGVYAILPRRGNLLVTFQGAPFDEFQLPGGGIDPGESPLQALHREVFEETGWKIAKPRRLGAFRRFTYMPEYEIRAEKICEIYLAQPVHPLGPPGEEDHEPVWMAADVAKRMLANPGDRYFVQRFVG